MLRLRPDFLGGGVLGFVGGIVAALWNTAVDLAGQVVQGLVRNLGQPVLEAIGKAIAIAGIVSHVSTYLTGWNLQVQSSPGDLPFAVGTGPDHAGVFAVSEASGYRPWQPDLVRCARSFAIELPEVLAPGSPVRWEVQGNVGSDGTAPLIVEQSRDDVVPPSGRPQFRFVTGREDSAGGDLLIDAVTVHVRLSHDELRRVLDLGKRLIDSTIDGLVGTALPVPGLAEQVRPLVHGLVDPLVRQLDAAITDGTRSVFELHAQDRVIVYHHGPPDPTTIPPPETAPPDPRAAFCAKLDELYPLAAEWVDWATTGVAGIAAIEQLTPLAPAELQDEMATMMAMYQAASQVSGPLPDEGVLAVAESFANAAITVFEYCGFDPSVIGPSGMARRTDH